MSRRAKAIEAIRQAVICASSSPAGENTIRADQILDDEDLIEDLSLDAMELESLALILEEIFQGISVDPISLWAGPIYRSIESLADWCIRKADEAAWAESQRQRRRA